MPIGFPIWVGDVQMSCAYFGLNMLNILASHLRGTCAPSGSIKLVIPRCIPSKRNVSVKSIDNRRRLESFRLNVHGCNPR